MKRLKMNENDNPANFSVINKTYPFEDLHDEDVYKRQPESFERYEQMYTLKIIPRYFVLIFLVVL